MSNEPNQTVLWIDRSGKRSGSGKPCRGLKEKTLQTNINFDLFLLIFESIRFKILSSRPIK